MPADPLVEVEHYRHGKVPREVRERQVLAVAEELFAERGYAGTSMEEICRRTGLSRPVVYDVGGTKADLYARMVERVQAQLRQAIVTAATEVGHPADALRVGITAYLRFVAEHRALMDVVLAGSGDPQLQRSAEQGRRLARVAIAELVETGARHIGPGLEPRAAEALAHVLDAACEGVAHWWLRHDPGLPAEQLADWVTDLLAPGVVAMGQRGRGP